MHGAVMGQPREIDLRALAKEMRKKPTRAERVIWERVRNRRLGGFKFRRQHVAGGRIVDFFNWDALLVVEIDGGVHHTPEQQQRDLYRDVGFALLGYKTVRFTNEEVLHHTDDVCARLLDIIYERIEEQRQSLRPSRESRGAAAKRRGEV
jgi:very-short-patch-repair endonuclease